MRIARVHEDGITAKAIIGHVGLVDEIDDTFPHIVEIGCETCTGHHTMNTDELELIASEAVILTMQAAGISDENLETHTEQHQALEAFIAVAMHKAGFQRVSVQDRDIPFADPRIDVPIWSKYVYGTIGKMTPLSVVAEALIKIAREAGGYLAEWAAYSYKSGYSEAITASELDHMALEMPFRAVFNCNASTGMNEYDHTKESVIAWLESKQHIDMGAIFLAMRDLGFRVSNWTTGRFRDEDNLQCYGFQLIPVRGPLKDSKNRAKFMEWAEKNWIWTGEFCINVGSGYQEKAVIIVRNHEGEMEIKEEEDVPF